MLKKSKKKTTGHVQPKKHGGSPKSVLHSRTTEFTQMVEKYPNSTLSEYCEYWLMDYKEAISPSMMSRELKKQNLTKKKTMRSSQSAIKVQIYMREYWEKVKNIGCISLWQIHQIES